MCQQIFLFDRYVQLEMAKRARMLAEALLRLEEINDPDSLLAATRKALASLETGPAQNVMTRATALFGLLRSAGVSEQTIKNVRRAISDAASDPEAFETQISLVSQFVMDTIKKLANEFYNSPLKNPGDNVRRIDSYKRTG